MSDDATDELRQLRGMVDLGWSCETFWKSDVGQYLSMRTQAMADEATAALKKVNANETEKIIELQNTIRVCEELFYDAIEEAINEGAAARETLAQEGIED